MGGTLNNTIGFDDGPFRPDHRGDVDLIGAVCCGDRLDGVLCTRVRRDGINSTNQIAAAVKASRFCEHVQLILLQGIAVAGFNVIDIDTLSKGLSLPVIVVARHEPDLNAVRNALLHHVPGGRRKWRLIERAGPPMPGASVWLQFKGITMDQAVDTVRQLAVHGAIPEPLRLAHLIAGGISDLETHQRP